MNGLRGVGKTVLLDELLAHVTERGWLATTVEATPGTPTAVALSHALVKAMRTATGRHPIPALKRLLGVFQAFSVKCQSCDWHRRARSERRRCQGVADSGRFGDDLAALFEVLGETSRELGIGTLILVDELQEATGDELTAVNTAVHLWARRRFPAGHVCGSWTPVATSASWLMPPVTQNASTTTGPSVCLMMQLRARHSSGRAQSAGLRGAKMRFDRHSLWPAATRTPSRR